MERGSSKHSPVIDELMKEEVEPMLRGASAGPRVEHRDPEPSGDDEPESDARLGEDDVEARSKLARYIDRVAFPGDRSALAASAEKNEAPTHVIEALKELPEGVEYLNTQQIWVALGGEPEERF